MANPGFECVLCTEEGISDENEENYEIVYYNNENELKKHIITVHGFTPETSNIVSQATSYEQFVEAFIVAFHELDIKEVCPACLQIFEEDMLQDHYADDHSFPHFHRHLKEYQDNHPEAPTLCIPDEEPNDDDDDDDD